MTTLRRQIALKGWHCLAAVSVCAGAVVNAVQAQSYPQRPIRIIVGHADLVLGIIIPGSLMVLAERVIE